MKIFSYLLIKIIKVYQLIISPCLEAHSFGDISINSFGKSFVENLKRQAEASQSEEEVKEILNRLYDITSCEP